VVSTLPFSLGDFIFAVEVDFHVSGFVFPAVSTSRSFCFIASVLSSLCAGVSVSS